MIHPMYRITCAVGDIVTEVAASNPSVISAWHISVTDAGYAITYYHGEKCETLVVSQTELVMQTEAMLWLRSRLHSMVRRLSAND